jgi:hypothetical protein
VCCRKGQGCDCVCFEICVLVCKDVRRTLSNSMAGCWWDAIAQHQHFPLPACPELLPPHPVFCARPPTCLLCLPALFYCPPPTLQAAVSWSSCVQLDCQAAGSTLGWMHTGAGCFRVRGTGCFRCIFMACGWCQAAGSTLGWTRTGGIGIGHYARALASHSAYVSGSWVRRSPQLQGQPWRHVGRFSRACTQHATLSLPAHLNPIHASYRDHSLPSSPVPV